MPDADPDATPPHVNGTRKWIADHSSPRLAYEAFRSLAEARTRSDALVVLDLDAEPYDPLATFPARRVEADEATLERLRVFLAGVYVAVEHPAVPDTSGRLRFETGEVLAEWEEKRLGGIYLHPKLWELGLEREVEAVFVGVCPDLDLDVPRRIAACRTWWEAVDNGDVGAVRRLVDQDFPIVALQREGSSALQAATRAEDLAMARVLLECGADPNQVGGRGWTPLTEAVSRMVKSGRGTGDANLALLPAAGGRPGLREAVMLGDVELARRFLDADPAIDLSADAGFYYSYSFLLNAILSGHFEMVRFLLDRGADLHQPDRDIGYTALTMAADCGRADIAALLLDRGADIDHVSGDDHTPLSLAADYGHSEVFRLLLARGARRRRTLTEAVYMKDADLVAELLSSGDEAKPMLEEALGQCGMHLARRGDVGILRMLLDAWAELGEGSPFYKSFLCDAAEAGRLEVVRVLIERGFDPTQADYEGVTPLEHAERAGHAEVAEMLRAALRAR